MKKYLLLLVLFLSFQGYCQDLNQYQYAIVPAKFDFLKEKDKYRLNTLTKLLMEKHGFITYLTTDIQPEEIANTNCNKVFVDVLENSSLFVTKVKVVLKDCKNNVLFTTEEGTSREKEFGAGFNEALRNAFKSFDKLNHKYNGAVVKEEAIIPTKKEETPKETVVLKENFETTNPTATILVFKSKSKVDYPEPLFAKPFENGFQLLTNNTSIPRYVMTIQKTSSADCYLAEKENTHGVLLRKSGYWVFNYYKDGRLVSEIVPIVNF
jgi:hypothetical protein